MVASQRWAAPRISLFAAALAFHALLALAPLILLLLSVAGPLLGQEVARRSLAEAVTRFAGIGADQAVAAILEDVAGSRWSAGMTIVGAALMLHFATAFFLRLRGALDAVWEVRRVGLARNLWDRVTVFAETLVALAAALFVLATGALRTVVWPFMERAGAAGAFAWIVWTHFATLMMTVIALAAAYRYVPFVRPRPRLSAVLAGAVPTALILNLANHLLGIIVTRSALASLYGAAGSLIVILLWLQYAAWIFLFGAEVGRAWDEHADQKSRAAETTMKSSVEPGLNQ
ncbi:MAG TPA: YhjD/YihY/BrkB family envelope integrity protein [Candidatus Polarisedimenticolia bacterium]|nr:YhjD/YihY/BrkB family envelope integrity protein [Candidatus Polarisedimenticolia bacterium]